MKMSRCKNSGKGNDEIIAGLLRQLPDRYTANLRHDLEDMVRILPQIQDLGDELTSRLLRGPGDDLVVSIGAVKAILECPEDLRPRAVQMVLYSALEEFSLKERQAREVLRKHVIEPHDEEKEWHSWSSRAAMKGWKRRFRKMLSKHEYASLRVEIPLHELQELGNGYIDAESLFPVPSGADHAITWLRLAALAGEPILIVRKSNGSRALVNSGRLRDWLAAGGDVPPVRKNRRSELQPGEGLSSYVLPADRLGTPVPRAASTLEGWHLDPRIDWPHLIVGTRDGAKVRISKAQTGSGCVWTAPGCSLPQQELQKSWLREVRKGISFDRIENLTGVSRRTWEAFEGGRNLPFATAFLIHQRQGSFAIK